MLWYRKYAPWDTVLERLERQAREAKKRLVGRSTTGATVGRGGRVPNKLHGESSLICIHPRGVTLLQTTSFLPTHT